MPYGIRPSNVRVCHFTTRASRDARNYIFITLRQGRKRSFALTADQSRISHAEDIARKASPGS